MLELTPNFDIVRTLDLGLAGFAWVFVLVESLNKRVDVPALKARLDIRDAQVMAGVIAEIEAAIVPFLGSAPADILIDENEDEFSGEDSEQIEDETPAFLGEAARSALARSLRKSEAELNCMYEIRRIPLRVLRLNGRVFWCVLCVALSASAGAFIGYLIVPMPNWLGFSTLAAPLACAGLAVVFSVMRHLKVQSAEESIVDANSSF
jgi:hypothetical protein